jgi:hypothetical protein
VGARWVAELPAFAFNDLTNLFTNDVRRGGVLQKCGEQCGQASSLRVGALRMSG